MPLPGNIETCTVTGTYLDYSGEPMTGEVRFIAAPKIVRDPGASAMLVHYQFVAPLVDGAFSIDLPYTDDPDVIPTDWYYKVSERFDGFSREWNVQLPMSLGETVDISALESAGPVPRVITYVPRATFDQHVAATTSVHGISDTSLLETKAGALAKATAAQNAAIESAAALYARKDRTALNVLDFGAVADDATDCLNAFDECAATATVLGGEMLIPAGTYLFSAVWSLDGVSCTIRGMGAKSVLHGAHSGIVMDLTGYGSPANGVGRNHIESFMIRGNNTAGQTGNIGLNMPPNTSPVTGIVVRDVSVRETGGIGINFGASLLCDFERLIVMTPAGAAANDVPYMKGAGPCNGNRFVGLGFRSVTSGADTGVSGALVFTDDGSFSPELNVFLGTWFEFLHVANGGCLIGYKGQTTDIIDTQFFDCSKVSGASGTAAIRLGSPAIANNGGNTVTGHILGRDGALGIDYGVQLAQSRNVVRGIRGFGGFNVILDSGVGNSVCIIGGAQSGISNATFVDNSGQNTNILQDLTAGQVIPQYGEFISDINNNGMRLYLKSTPNIGRFYLGNQGVQLQTIAGGTDLYGSADAWYFRNIAASLVMLNLNGSGAPGAIFNSASGHPAVRASRAIETSRATQTLAANGAVAIDSSASNVHTITLQANATSSSITNPPASGANTRHLTITWLQDGTGGRTYAWPANAKFAGGAAPNDTTANLRTSVSFLWDGTNWNEISRAVAVG